MLGLETPEALRAGWARLHERVAKARPGLALDGVLIESMGGKGVELIVGARNERDWGPVLLVGFGGVMAELFQDARLIPANLSPEEIVLELDKLKSAALLRGFRGAPAVDVAAAAEIVAQVGKLIQCDPRIREIDVNPIVVYPEGEGAIALDGLIYIE